MQEAGAWGLGPLLPTSGGCSSSGSGPAPGRHSPQLRCQGLLRSRARGPGGVGGAGAGRGSLGTVGWWDA